MTSPPVGRQASHHVDNSESAPLASWSPLRSLSGTRCASDRTCAVLSARYSFSGRPSPKDDEVAMERILRAAVYTRVSTAEQVDTTSLSVQHDTCSDFAVSKG